MKKIIYLLTVAVLALNFSCKDNSTDPEEIKSVRDFSWTADTLTVPESSQTLMRSIWASSPINVYVCGHNSSNRGQLWRYGGTKWNDLHDNVFETVEIGAVSINNVHGSSANNVWAVGSRDKTNPAPPPNSLYSSFIIQYDGTKWIEHKVNTKSAIYGIYVNSPNDVWACGFDGITYHYDGTKWDVDTVKITLTQNEKFSIYSIAKINTQVYCIGLKSESLTINRTYYFYKRENNKWLEIDSFTLNYSGPAEYKWGVKDLFVSTNKELYSTGYGLYKLNNNLWERIYLTQIPITWMSDIGNNDILLTGEFGEIYHYNRTDWKKLDQFDNENFVHSASWRDKKEAFIVTQDFSGFPQKTIIWHGK